MSRPDVNTKTQRNTAHRVISVVDTIKTNMMMEGWNHEENNLDM